MEKGRVERLTDENGKGREDNNKEDEEAGRKRAIAMLVVVMMMMWRRRMSIRLARACKHSDNSAL